MSDKLQELKRKIEALSPAARLLMASQLVAKGDYDAVDVGMTIAENTVLEWQAAKLLAKAGTR
jgi:hypothetical protein